jgi:anti-sigma factor RsiW
MACDREKEVHDYHDGRLSPAAREAFESHMSTCVDCAGLLVDLRSLSRLISAAPMPEPEMSASTAQHYYNAWHIASGQRGLLRISSGLTAAAAALLLGSLLFWPRQSPPAAELASDTWEMKAVMPPSPERTVERPDDLIELAQWMADDLSDDTR